MSEKVLAPESVEQIGYVLESAKDIKSDVESALKADERLDLVNLHLFLERLHRLGERVDMIIIYTLFYDKKDSLKEKEKEQMIAAIKRRNPDSFSEWEQYFLEKQ